MRYGTLKVAGFGEMIQVSRKNKYYLNIVNIMSTLMFLDGFYCTKNKKLVPYYIHMNKYSTFTPLTV